MSELDKAPVGAQHAAQEPPGFAVTIRHAEDMFSCPHCGVDVYCYGAVGPVDCWNCGAAVEINRLDH